MSLEEAREAIRKFLVTSPRDTEYESPLLSRNFDRDNRMNFKNKFSYRRVFALRTPEEIARMKDPWGNRLATVVKWDLYFEGEFIDRFNNMRQLKAFIKLKCDD